MTYYWLATEARTGKIITDLSLLDVTSVKRTIGQYESATATLPVAAKFAPAGWQRATMEGATILWLLADNPNDPARGIPVVGLMINRTSPDDSDTLKLDLATLEAYLDRRYVGDKTYVQVGQNNIIADLINSYVLDGSGGVNGLPIRVQTSGPGALRDRTYLDIDDKTVYSVMTSLSGVIGGPEFTIGGEWQSNPERITPVIFVADRIGSAVTPGLLPSTTFEMPGSVTSFKMVRDFSSGKGATSVIAVSTANGNVRPQSPAQVSAQNERPSFEMRYTPSTSITDIDTLTSHAKSALGNLAQGAISVALASIDSVGTRLGVDWSLGDDIGFVIGSDVPAFPNGLTGRARAISWMLTLGNTPEVTPTLTNAVIS